MLTLMTLQSPALRVLILKDFAFCQIGVFDKTQSLAITVRNKNDFSTQQHSMTGPSDGEELYSL
jgi:hypothetical protein